MVGMYTCGNSLTCYLYPHFLLAESDFSPTSPSFHAHLYNAAVACTTNETKFFCEVRLRNSAEILVPAPTCLPGFDYAP